jgi:Na+/glutamate symporter
VPHKKARRSGLENGVKFTGDAGLCRAYVAGMVARLLIGMSLAALLYAAPSIGLFVCSVSVAGGVGYSVFIRWLRGYWP